MHAEALLRDVRNKSHQHTISERSSKSNKDVDLSLWFQVHLQTHKHIDLLFMNNETGSGKTKDIFSLITVVFITKNYFIYNVEVMRVRTLS